MLYPIVYQRVLIAKVGQVFDNMRELTAFGDDKSVF